VEGKAPSLPFSDVERFPRGKPAADVGAALSRPRKKGPRIESAERKKKKDESSSSAKDSIFNVETDGEKEGAVSSSSSLSAVGVAQPQRASQPSRPPPPSLTSHLVRPQSREEWISTAEKEGENFWREIFSPPVAPPWRGEGQP